MNLIILAFLWPTVLNPTIIPLYLTIQQGNRLLCNYYSSFVASYFTALALF